MVVLWRRMPFLRAAHIRGTVALGALLRGRLEAEEVAFAKPELRLAFRADGKLDLPRPAGAARPLR